ncbi:cyclic nucleotide-binding domain-containing protein [Thermosipho ferrireducens]|uniref:Cyclic nucleotide-binding domain-containing protein n=1 Tax=Thermosipho ferrireducens TaxID=2571116 RepID=A0ABX7S7H3_9BACT|nr:cyclic nucleotide-binding domain-containing protein [Thermosipho ferrireducens]QTA38159.1 cyclic nucleotide-binding domain-containing protein [Thermosipho ferrireducens]
MKSLDIKAGEKIIEENTEATHVYLIKKGEVVVKYGDHEEILEEGNVFGIESLVGENYQENAIARTDVKLNQFSPEEFKELYAGTDVEKKALKYYTKRTMKLLGWI